MWTNDDRSSCGTLLFGGVDRTKYYSNKVTIDLAPSDFDGFTGVVDFTISLDGVTSTDASGNPIAFQGVATTVDVLMHSGTTITQLPDYLVISIWSFVGATAYPGSTTAAYVPC